MTGFDIWNELGNIYFKVGAFDEAIDAYNKAIELDFRIGWLYSNLGFAYVRKGKFAEAILMYEKSIELLNSDEDKAVSWSRLGEVYQQLNQYEQAVLAYQKAVELAPQDVSFGAGLSAARKQIGQSDQEVVVEETKVPVVAEPEVPEESSVPEDVVLADSDHEDESDLVVGTAVSRLFDEEIIPEVVLSVDDSTDAGNAPPGEELLEGTAAPTLELESDAVDVALAEETNPVPEMADDPAEEDADAERPAVTVVLDQDEIKITIVNSLLTSGIELWRKGDHEQAREILQDALEAAGKAENKWLEALSHNALALVKTELGKLEEAIASYTQAMQLAPEKIIPWNNIGHLYSKLDRNDEGMAAFLKAIEHNPEDFVSWDGLGDIYAKSGRLNDAIAAYQLGNVFGKQLRAEDALTAFQMIIEPERESVAEEPVYTAWVPEMPETLVADASEEAVEADTAFAAEESPLDTVSVDISDRVEISPEMLSADDVPLEMVAEIPQPVEESVVVDEVSSINDDVEVDDIALVAETPIEEPAPAASDVEDEMISSEDVLATSESAELDEIDIPEENLEEPVLAVSQTLDEADALDEDAIPVDVVQPEEEPAQSEDAPAVLQAVDESAAPENTVVLIADTDQVEHVVAGDQALEEMPVSVPEMTDETLVVEDEPATSAQADSESLIPVEDEEAVDEETTLEAEAEELLDSASSSLELSRLTSAIAAYKKVTEINPENDRAWDSLGNLYRASERYGDAVLAFEQAISLRPNKEVYHYHLGLVYAAEKHYEDAIGAFQKVIELNPEYTFAHCALAGYYRKLGKDAEAQEHIDKALPKMTSEKEYDRACFAAICGNTDEAIELLKIALEKKQTSLDWVRRDPDLDFIRDDRRFKALVFQNGSWSERLSDVFSKQLAWSQNK